jgi:hypothetical protein
MKVVNKSGVFEIPEENYKSLVEMYESVIKKISNDTFEEFCGKMVLEGTIQMNLRFLDLKSLRK